MTKLACITGASEGLGREFAYQLASLGYQTICIARNESRLATLVEELNQSFVGGHSYHVADLSTLQGVESCQLIFQANDVNVFINNAGFSQFGLFRNSEEAEQLKILDVNCRAVLQLSHVFLKYAKAGDSLINLSSITNYLTTPIQPVYCASKCFVAALSESLWFQERSRGVYVQALLPGITKTQFIERSSDIEGGKKQLLEMISMTPQAVVKTSLRAMRKTRGPTIIPGLSNKVIAVFLPLLPRRVAVYLLGKLGNLA